ncbi:MAG: branched-chain amino acid ABC transporter substrate-binding protein, partial [Halobacteriales archaeon SW_9_67_25]
MTRDHNRRTFVKLAGSAGVVGLTGLAGCSGDGGDGDGGDGSDGGDSNGGDGSDGDGGDGGDDMDGDDGGSTDDGMDVITLGGSMSLSGDNAEINEVGGVEAGDGNTYELEMVLRDDETDASKSRAVYQELIDQEGVQYLLGPYSSTVTLPASAVAANNQLPMVEGGGASPEIFSQGNEWIFGLLPTADKYPGSFIDMVSNMEPAPSRVALLSEDDTFSTSSAEGARNKIEGMNGLELVVDREFPTETSDLSTNLGRVRDNDADVLLLTAHQKHAVIAADQ